MSKTRPLSPHLGIYKPQITTVLSILHRITGFAIACATIVFVAWLFSIYAGDEKFQLFQTFRHSIIGQVMFFGWLFSLVYHMLCGIRHLKWSLGYGINMPSVYRSGWVLVFGSISLTILIWMAI